MLKFRLWDKKTKEWQSIRCIGLEDDGSICYVQCWDNYEEDIDPPYFMHNLGIDFELMQSTGLTDKNGKEIYEGDIVKGKADSFRLSCYGDVYFDKEFCCWRINDKKRNRKYDVDWRWELHVIGNIHENADLLK